MTRTRRAANRYKIAHEFVDVVRGLWDSWDEDALPIDKASATFFDPDKLHVLNHVGQHFKVRGPLTIPRSPQGQPVLVQAGSSDDGKTLAASVAEVIFTIQRDLAGAQAFYKDIKARAVAHGRNPQHALVLPGVMPIIGRTRQEAQDRVRAASGANSSGRRSQCAVAVRSVWICQARTSMGRCPMSMSAPSKAAPSAIVETARREHMTAPGGL